ncbi:MAG: hypothetical protein IPM45_09320 [Acidimicrobiales bacterium]|nr:hypothetical protein [Acidimicrobiales bacterium]
MTGPAAGRPAVAVAIEAGKRRVFASALDWPGWCRSGRDEERAVEALAAASARYAVVASTAGVRFAPGARFEVVERLPGSATTDFGAPGEVAARDLEPLTAAEARRLAALVDASWRVFDEVVAAAPAELRKGPRGGGRDRDAIAAHVVEAEVAYARKLGLRPPAPSAPGGVGATAARRRAIVEALRSARAGGATDRGWPPRYAARRIAWHVLDHAWEIEDRSPPGGVGPETAGRTASQRKPVR